MSLSLRCGDGFPVNEPKEKHMKTAIAFLLIATSVLAGCVVEPLYRSDYRGGHSYRDRDHDGVPNRHDRAPNNPWRY